MALINSICNFKEQPFASLPMEYRLTLGELPALNIWRSGSLLNPHTFQFLMLTAVLFSPCILAWLSQVSSRVSQKKHCFDNFPSRTERKKKNIQVRIQIAYFSATNWFKYLQAKFGYNKGREEKKEVGKGAKGGKWGERRAMGRRGRKGKGERESPNHNFQMMPHRQLHGLCFLFPSDAPRLKNLLIFCQIRK